jgi:hypothetical protein
VKENANFEDRYFSFPPVEVQIKFLGSIRELVLKVKFVGLFD